ncbi:hypothetical protein BD413DRAFT_464359 [Trametes elegans]|nr:hypothetical protein BD413DRAFT_464359 [Trametes elegans]
MSLNDKDIHIAGNRGVEPPGIAYPTSSSTYANPIASNFVSDPTNEALGAGAPRNFTGHKDAERNFKQTAGVVEGRPGIIESTNIAPLNENSNKDDGWANAQPGRTGASGVSASLGGAAQTAYNAATSVASGAASTASSVAQSAYNFVAGDEKSRRAGNESSV